MHASRALGLIALLLPSAALAQQADPVQSGAASGYELALTGATRVERGAPLRLFGVAYEVEGLAELRPREGLTVDVSITAREGSGYDRRTVARTSVTSASGGRFDASLVVPTEPLSAPMVELLVHRGSQPGRRFAFGLSALLDEELELLTDRNRYEPGERVRAWVRARGVRSLAPRAARAIRLTLMDASGERVATAAGTTGASGVVSADLALPDTAEAGGYTVTAELVDPPGPTVSRSVQVWRRTVERILAQIELRAADPDGVALVAPGGTLRGRVIARTPSGTPIRGAQVELRVRADAEPIRLTTGPDGAAPFEANAPAFLSGDVGRETVTARVIHAAYGTITASAGYLMARVRAVVDATARGGALVPEVPGTVYLSVSDPRGRPLRAGTVVVPRGEGVTSAQVAVDDRGYVEVPVTLPRGAASTLQTGPCAGRVATTLEVEVQTDPPVFSRVCVPVSAEAEVAPRVLGAPIVGPGQTIDVEVDRRPAAASRAVLVEALWNDRAVAFAWIAPRERRAQLALPAELLGVVTIRARAAREPDAREPSTEPGANAFSVGAFDVLLVRPSDAFAFAVAPGRERYLVRERAQIELSASRAPAEQGWAALVVRDEAAHGGEGPWDLWFLSGELHQAAWQPASEANARLLRAALSAGVGIDPEPPRPPPLEAPYWIPQRYRPPYSPGMQAGRGVLRDPVALREELLRRGLAPVERVLEQAVSNLGASAPERARIVRGNDFAPDVVATLVAAHQIGDGAARTLGGEPITVAMVEAADPGFSFDTVARRVTRARLARVLLALSRLTDPDDPNAQRVSGALPPDRWLGTLVQLSMLPARDLTDAWGHPFVFRHVGRRARVAVSDRALEWELASPGPDGRAGTGDDLVDPFARAVPEGTPYAVTSGEDELLRRFGSLAPASLVLTRMSQAYDRLSLAATEEQREGPVTATGSETADEAVAYDFEQDLDGAEGGGGRGGAAMARSIMPASPAGAPAPPPVQTAPAEPEMPPREALAEEERQQRADTGRTATLGALVREDFPATLFFVGEVPLNERGEATVEVPLADALTTYRLEAIAWTSSGWTTSAISRLRVDQPALVDAPVPPYATAGDVLRLPVRVENRMEEPLPVRVEVRAEGDLALDDIAPIELAIPGREAREAVVIVPLREAGEGSLVVSVARQGGEGLDAVRRPLVVLADARTARERRLELVDGTHAVTIEVPPQASARGPGQLALAIGARLFGDPEQTVGDPLWAGWALAMAGETLPEGIADEVLAWVSYEDDGSDYLRPPQQSALALASTWADPRLTDGDAARALRAVGQYLPSPEALRADPGQGAGADSLLLALGPVARQLDRRPALREDAERLIERLARVVSSTSASATDAPSQWTRAAAALAVTHRSRARAEEKVRRTERHVVRVGPIAWVEPEDGGGTGDARAQPTALMSLALSALGRRGDALAFVRALLDMHRPPAEEPLILRPSFEGADLALASAAASALGGGDAPDTISATLDGHALEPVRQGAVSVTGVPGIGEPGSHTLRIELPAGTVALARVSFAYGMPWDAPPPRSAPIELAIDGEIGARDTRSGALLHVQNRGARLLTRPVVEVELPAGAELDEPTRDALAEHLRAPARQDGRTLVLPLRAMAPGARLRLPIRVRWAVAGTLRGLGAVAYDDVDPFDAPVLPVAVLPSRAVEIPDEGPEPEAPDAERSEPLPIPPPIPLLERLTPGGA